MNLHYDCMVCQLKSQIKRAQAIDSEEKRISFLKETCLALSQADERYAIGAGAPLLARINRRYALPETDYAALKKLYNDKMLSLLPDLKKQVAGSSRPLYEALRICRAGNYIDFGAFSQIDDEQLLSNIQKAQADKLDPAEYECLQRDLSRARTLTYIVDNCGEIVLDLLVLQQITRLYPHVEITLLARGEDVLNDATVKDALYVGADTYARVMGNGSNLAGTQIQLISQEARDLLSGSDIIIAKGMGNFETMCGCGLNVYYIFLCKCDFFSRRLNVPLMTGMLLNEKRMGTDIL